MSYQLTLSSAFSEEDRLDRSEHDHKVHEDGPVLNVKQIVLEFFDVVF